MLGKKKWHLKNRRNFFGNKIERKHVDWRTFGEDRGVVALILNS